MQKIEKRYFIRRHDRISGPYTREELEEKGVESGTEVWDDEAFNWYEAGEFAELRDILDRPASRTRRGLWNWVRRRMTSSGRGGS